jgi:hypothetical protein
MAITKTQFETTGPLLQAGLNVGRYIDKKFIIPTLNEQTCMYVRTKHDVCTHGLNKLWPGDSFRHRHAHQQFFVNKSGAINKWRGTRATNHYFCWAKLNQRMHLSPPPPQFGNKCKHLWERALIRVQGMHMGYYIFNNFRVWARNFTFFTILQCTHAILLLYNVTILHLSSFAQPQSKCLLLFLVLECCEHQICLKKWLKVIWHPSDIPIRC